jgi:hypothetical protein
LVRIQAPQPNKINSLAYFAVRFRVMVVIAIPNRRYPPEPDAVALAALVV